MRKESLVILNTWTMLISSEEGVVVVQGGCGSPVRRVWWSVRRVWWSCDEGGL